MNYSDLTTLNGYGWLENSMLMDTSISMPSWALTPKKVFEAKDTGTCKDSIPTLYRQTAFSEHWDMSPKTETISTTDLFLMDPNEVGKTLSPVRHKMNSGTWLKRLAPKIMSSTTNDLNTTPTRGTKRKSDLMLVDSPLPTKNFPVNLTHGSPSRYKAM